MIPPLTEFQQIIHNLLIVYAESVLGRTSKTARDYTESMERYLPKEARFRFGIEFPETAYDVLDVNELQKVHDIIEENSEWKEYDRISHGSTFRSGLKCLIAMKQDEEFLRSHDMADTLFNPNVYKNVITDEKARLKEGKVYESHATRYERNPKMRMICINHYGCKCYVCGFDFSKHYGEHGYGFIEVHHRTPLSELKMEYITSPIEGLVPLCSNCHSMIHRTEVCMTVEELKEMWEKYNKKIR